jgi:carotenoid cleavage dioxygenase-like enzyme
MVHDFAVTEHHIVFPVVPLVSDLQRLKDGYPNFAWGSVQAGLPRSAAHRKP